KRQKLHSLPRLYATVGRLYGSHQAAVGAVGADVFLGQGLPKGPRSRAPHRSRRRRAGTGLAKNPGARVPHPRRKASRPVNQCDSAAPRREAVINATGLFRTTRAHPSTQSTNHQTAVKLGAWRATEVRPRSWKELGAKLSRNTRAK